MELNVKFIILIFSIVLVSFVQQGKMKILNSSFFKVRLHPYFFIVKGYGIKCWDCRSDADPKCSDPFDNTTFAITDCKQLRPLSYLPGVQATMCRKIRQKGIAYLGYN